VILVLGKNLYYLFLSLAGSTPREVSVEVKRRHNLGSQIVTARVTPPGLRIVAASYAFAKLKARTIADFGNRRREDAADAKVLLPGGRCDL
jgi:hypothetical protein